MSVSSLISRFATYVERHGVLATVQRLTLTVTRRVHFSQRTAIFYCDLASQTQPPGNLPDGLTVERGTSLSELSSSDLQEILHLWNPELARKQLKERFSLGASVWLLKFYDKLAGYLWTLEGRTLEPYYFPLGPKDVHFFDLYILPAYRGRPGNIFLVSLALHRLALEKRSRAFCEVNEWNQASFFFQRMTPFRLLCWGRKLSVLGHAVVYWSDSTSARRVPVRKNVGEQPAWRETKAIPTE